MVAERQVRLVLLDRIERSVLDEVIQQVAEVLGARTILETDIHCEDGFDPARRQWRAETILERCVRPYTHPDCPIVGLTGRDIYVPPLNFVFGLAFRQSGGEAIVSWHRLIGKEKTLAARIAKEVIHEVGHIEGLDHCRNEECVMWFSNTLAETDRKKREFCPVCRVRRSR